MSIELVIVTPEGEAYAGPVDQVVLPGSEGRFGVLQNHERVLAPLQPGAVEIQNGGSSEWAAVSNGFADVSMERVVVLADMCTLAHDLDRSKVEEAKSEAEAELEGLGDDEHHDSRRETLLELIRQCEVELEVLSK